VKIPDICCFPGQPSREVRMALLPVCLHRARAATSACFPHLGPHKGHSDCKDKQTQRLMHEEPPLWGSWKGYLWLFSETSLDKASFISRDTRNSPVHPGSLLSQHSPPPLLVTQVISVEEAIVGSWLNLLKNSEIFFLSLQL
jgi:hypothetical protein